MLNSKLISNLYTIALLLSFLATIPFATVSIASKGHFIGAVYGPSLMPIEGAIVIAYGLGGSGTATTDSLGQYTITGDLNTGNYNVTASATGFADAIITNVQVTAGQETPNVNFVLTASGGISGKVTEAISGLPLASVVVAAFNASGFGSAGGTGLTGIDGTYSITTNLPTGTYNVTVFEAKGHLTNTVTPVSVIAQVVTENVDLVLQKSATITGTVTDSTSGTPLPDIGIAAESANFLFGGSAITNSTGQYTIDTNIATGTYNVSARFPMGYLSKTIANQAVTAGLEYTVDIPLDRSGIISGLVTEEISGTPIADANVFAQSDIGDYTGTAQTNASGHYRIDSGLGTGTYTVSAYTSMGMGGYGQVLNVSVTAGSETTNVDIQVTIIPPLPSGAIAGRVTNTTGSPIEFATVTAKGAIFGFGQATTDSNGNYNITSGLDSGTYTVNASAIGYVMQSQTNIEVTVNQTTANVDFVLSPIISGSISGTVQSSENPIPEFPYQTPLLILFASTIGAIAFIKLRHHRTKNETD